MRAGPEKIERAVVEFVVSANQPVPMRTVARRVTRKLSVPYVEVRAAVWRLVDMGSLNFGKNWFVEKAP